MKTRKYRKEVMKVKIIVTQILKNYKGEDILSNLGDGKKVKLSFRDVVSTSINATPLPPAKPMTAEVKNKAYQISIKLFTKKRIDLTVDQRAFIKERVGDVYNPLVYGRVCDILEGKDEPKAKGKT